LESNDKTIKFMKKISIVTASFNSEKFIEQTINSVLSQNYPNLEYIIIDGSSTDKTVDIIKKYQHSLAYWTSEKDNSMYDAINKGFRKSTGDIMGWLNSDDLLHPGSLSVINQIFSQFDNVNWVTGIPTKCDSQGRTCKVADLPIWSKEKYYIGQLKSIQQESTFWTRSLWEKAGSKLDEQYTLAADHELWARFFLYEDLYTINALLGCFRKHDYQLTEEKRDEYFKQVNQIRNQYKKKIKGINYLSYKTKTFANNILPGFITKSNKYNKHFIKRKLITYNFEKNKFVIK